MEKLKLNVLEKDELEKRSMVNLKGGVCCCCACAYADEGGSSSVDNGRANDADCLRSPECPETF